MCVAALLDLMTQGLSSRCKLKKNQRRMGHHALDRAWSLVSIAWSLAYLQPAARACSQTTWLATNSYHSPPCQGLCRRGAELSFVFISNPRVRSNIKATMICHLGPEKCRWLLDETITRCRVRQSCLPACLQMQSENKKKKICSLDCGQLRKKNHSVELRI
ncbi:hypothetical protein BDV18DRAFT_129228 [Aspergillus unguis]